MHKYCILFNIVLDVCLFGYVGYYYFTDMTKASLKWEYDYKRSEEERESIDNAMDKLRNDMSVADSKRKELAEQVC